MIGLFNDSFPPIMDGVAVCTWNYAYWLNEKKTPASVITPNTPNAPTEPFPVYRYSSLPLLFRKPYRIGLPTIDFRFQFLLDKTPFKLLHAHCPFTTGQMALRLAHKRKIPFIATFHSKYRDDFERSFKSRKIADMMIKEVISFYEKADEVWIPQAAVEETIREYGYKGNVVVMENGNDFVDNQDVELIKIDAREYLGIQKNENILLFVGQHIWEKNTRLIIDALAQIKNLDFKMFFVGTGYASDEMKDLVKSVGLTEKVFFKGVITNREMLRKYYAAADIFVFPSIYDNAPLVVREAAAMRTPSILAKNSTASEIIIDNFNGFLTANDPKSLAHKITELLLDKSKIQSAGSNASYSIARSWSSIIDEVNDRYTFWKNKNH